MYPHAQAVSWWRVRVKVSMAKALNVVNPPKKPTVSHKRQSAETPPARQTSKRRPMRKHPRQLTPRVPKGNNPLNCCRCEASIYRVNVPAPPAIHKPKRRKPVIERLVAPAHGAPKRVGAKVHRAGLLGCDRHAAGREDKHTVSNALLMTINGVCCAREEIHHALRLGGIQ